MKKNSSSGFYAGLIIAIVISSVVVIIGLFTIVIVCGRAKTPPSYRNNLPKKRNDFSSSEINRVANSGN